MKLRNHLVVCDDCCLQVVWMAAILYNEVPQSVERFGLPYGMMLVLDLKHADIDHVITVVVGSTTSWFPSCWGRLEVVKL